MRITKIDNAKAITFGELKSGDFFKDGSEILVKLDRNVDEDGSAVNCYEITTHSFYKFDNYTSIIKVEIEEIVYKEI